MKSYSLEGLDLAHAIRSSVLGQPPREPSLSTLVGSLSQLCEQEAVLLARGSKSGKTDLEAELQALLVAALRSDPLLYAQTLELPTFCGQGGGLLSWGIVAVHHSPLGGGRSEREGALLKRGGARAGWPDLDLRFVDLRGQRRSVLLELKAPGGKVSKVQLELKAPGGKVSKVQLETVKTLTGAGFEASVATGLAEMVGEVVRLLRG